MRNVPNDSDDDDEDAFGPLPSNVNLLNKCKFCFLAEIHLVESIWPKFNFFFKLFMFANIK